MADTPSDGGTDTPTPRRPRKARTASARATGTRVVSGRTPRAKSPARVVADAADKAVKPATKRKASAAARPAVGAATKAVKTVKDAVVDAAPSTRSSNFAVAAAVAGVAAGVAALFGRRKLVKVANDAIGAVGGNKGKPEIPLRAD